MKIPGYFISGMKDSCRLMRGLGLSRDFRRDTLSHAYDVTGLLAGTAAALEDTLNDFRRDGDTIVYSPSLDLSDDRVVSVPDIELIIRDELFGAY